MNKNAFSNHTLVLFSPKVVIRKDVTCERKKKVVRRYFCGKTVTEITTTMSKDISLRFALMAKSIIIKGMVLKIMFIYFSLKMDIYIYTDAF